MATAGGGHPALRVAHRRRGVVGRAEVAVPVDGGQAHRPGLGQPDQGVVDRAVSVRVQAAHDLADDAGALHVPAVGAQVHLVHRVEDAALDRLEPVSRVGQRPGVDDGVGVLEERGLHLVLDVGVEDVLLEVLREGLLGAAPCHARILPGGTDEPTPDPPTRAVPAVQRRARPPSTTERRAASPAADRLPSHDHQRGPPALGGGRPAAGRAHRARPAGAARGRAADGRLLRPGVRRVEVLPVLRPDADALGQGPAPVHQRRPRRPGGAGRCCWAAR